MSLESFLVDHGVTQTDLGAVLGCDPSAISHKLAGRRPWFRDEITTVLRYLRDRTGEPVTFEQLFDEPCMPAAANE